MGIPSTKQWRCNRVGSLGSTSTSTFHHSYCAVQLNFANRCQVEVFCSLVFLRRSIIELPLHFPSSTRRTPPLPAQTHAWCNLNVISSFLPKTLLGLKVQKHHTIHSATQHHDRLLETWANLVTPAAASQVLSSARATLGYRTMHGLVVL